MGVEVVLQEADFVGLRVFQGEFLEKQGLFALGALLIKFAQTRSAQRFDSRQQAARAFFGVGMV
jgi:hypothetical protein